MSAEPPLSCPNDSKTLRTIKPQKRGHEHTCNHQRHVDDFCSCTCCTLNTVSCTAQLKRGFVLCVCVCVDVAISLTYEYGPKSQCALCPFRKRQRFIAARNWHPSTEQSVPINTTVETRTAQNRTQPVTHRASPR